jgi:hypothetical protein
MAARLLEVNKATGWLQWRPSMVAPLLAQKERAALDESRILAAMPVSPDDHLYLLLDRRSGQGRVLPGRPDSSDVSARRLWDALQLNFAGELGSPVMAKPVAQLSSAHETTVHATSSVGGGH